MTNNLRKQQNLHPLKICMYMVMFSVAPYILGDEILCHFVNVSCICITSYSCNYSRSPAIIAKHVPYNFAIHCSLNIGLRHYNSAVAAPPPHT